MSSPTTTRPAPPPLRDGDALTREEFERRYDAMPDVKKAELIEGVVHMPSPVHWHGHASPHVHASTWLGTYEAATPGVQAGDNGTIRLAMESMPQPDNALIVLPTHGGRATISEDDFLMGGPELAVEVAAASAWMDRGAKLRLYRDNGVQEYLIWLVLQGRVEWLALDAGQYAPVPPGPDGVLRSRVFPGLWLDGDALARRDLGRVLAVLGQGLASPGHAAFVAELAARAEAGPLP